MLVLFIGMSRDFDASFMIRIQNAFIWREKLCVKLISTGLELPVLSMGMSEDFEAAFMVRIRTLLFGARNYA